MLRSSISTLADFHILDARRLTRRPMDASRRRSTGNISKIDNQVPDLPVEYICGGPALVTVTLVLVTIDDT